MPPNQSPETIGPYRILATLPDRGLGSEYLALGGQGVVRLLVLDGVKPPLLKRLKRRLREAATLRDPGLERVLELTDARGSAVVVTEGIQGVTLEELLEGPAEPLDPVVLAGIVAQAAKGLHALHQHRDRRETALEWVHAHLSPSNVLVAWSGRVVVTQIAFAELAAARVTQHFQYFSPEQARAAALDARSDVFSLGLILYEAWTKTHPFSTRSLPDYMLSVLSDQPRDAGEQNPGLSRELADVVMRCIERDPQRRFADCSELANALFACPKVLAAAEESNLSAMLAEHYATQRKAAEKLEQRAAAQPPLPAPSGRARLRPLLLFLLVLAVGLAILAWAMIGRAAPTC